MKNDTDDIDMRADFEIRQGWGNHIEWFFVDFSKINFNKDTLGVWGHMPIKPKRGNTLICEFQKSFIKFEFISVDYPGNPPDMFFGKVKAVEQKMK